MSISAETCLRGVLYTLQERIAPLVDDPFGQEAARLSALVVSIVANSIDDAAAIRVAENKAIRAIFRQARAIVTSPDLAERLREKVNSADLGLRISELDRENDSLRSLLIELHAHAETINGEHARVLCGAIWRALAEFERARAPKR